jgi:hypothetical protein
MLKVHLTTNIASDIVIYRECVNNKRCPLDIFKLFTIITTYTLTATPNDNILT